MHQYLFHIGDFPIRMYGLVLCMSIFFSNWCCLLSGQTGWPLAAAYPGHWYLRRLCRFDRRTPLGCILFDWDYYQHHLLEIPFVWQGGMAIQGGVIAGVLAGIWYCKRHQIDWLAFSRYRLSRNFDRSGNRPYGQSAERRCFRNAYRR